MAKKSKRLTIEEKRELVRKFDARGEQGGEEFAKEHNIPPTAIYSYRIQVAKADGGPAKKQGRIAKTANGTGKRKYTRKAEAAVTNGGFQPNVRDAIKILQEMQELPERDPGRQLYATHALYYLSGKTS